jgi:oxygen-independent coproporphyrinogen III oxidase
VSENLGVYIHIPYCLQRCTYCDFATYVHNEILPPEKYVELVKKEISLKKHVYQKKFLNKALSTIYFGGGTPSLISADLIISLISELSKHGFTTGPQTEITIEINPATVDPQKLEQYLAAGVNRFSVGAQTFHDRLLKSVNREHNAKQTFDTLELLRKYNLNFSFDLLFALPTQTLKELESDVETAIQLGSSHISPYCLTVPEGHPLSKNRPVEDEQIEMFNVIHEKLTAKNFNRYEISNYSLPQKESQHNLLYWQDKPYWGLGLSAHSYSQNTTWGERFWNASNINIYEQDILSGVSKSKDNQIEILEKNQALTDFCHTSLRLSEGLSLSKIENKFGSEFNFELQKISEDLMKRNLLTQVNDTYQLTDSGILISNQIFEKFTFLKT